MITGLEQAQPELGILADAPLGPAADAVQSIAANQRHRAVLDDRIAQAALHHADIEAAGIFPVTGTLQRAVAAVPIVLRRLPYRDLGPLEVRDQGPLPVRSATLVPSDAAAHTGLRPPCVVATTQPPRRNPPP